MQTIVIHITGNVQGVFFRRSAREKALASGITGTVRNLSGGSVQIMATGTKEQMDSLIAWCRKGPPGATVTGVEWQAQALQAFNGFIIVK